jgi:hypothetical protein
MKFCVRGTGDNTAVTISDVALTLDKNKNATFAGKVFMGGTVKGRSGVKMSASGVNWTDGNWSEVWNAANTPGNKYENQVFAIDTDRGGGVTGGIVGLSFCPGWTGHQNWGIYSLNNSGGAQTQGDLVFVSTIDDGTLSECVRLKPDKSTTFSGNIGIFDSDPDAPLHLKAQSNGWGNGLRMVNTSEASFWDIRHEYTSGNNSIWFGHDTVLKAKIEEDGDIFTVSGTDIQAISDRRMKKNIQDYSGGLDILKGLQPRTYEWKVDAEQGRTGTQYGFIAQEIEASGVEDNMNLFSKGGISDKEVGSSLIDDGEVYSTQLSSKEAIMISAIKELTTRLEALENA